MKVALLSNVNIDPVNRTLKKNPNLEVYESQGYGNELGVLLNKQSALYSFEPDAVFILIDVLEVIRHDLSVENVESKIKDWFSLFENAIEGGVIYYVSDAYLYGLELDTVWDKSIKQRIEAIWNDCLSEFVEKHSNVRILPYSEIIRKIGENNAFSPKMWYMGKILHSSLFHKELANMIIHKVDLESRKAKKVLLVDLDNTLWRGLAGEHDITPIILSDDGIGLAYKNFQRSISNLKNQGVILGIVSKNNEDDAWHIINNHPHMALRKDDFAVTRINWDNKADNILSIAQELNIGLDSIVFIDDNPVEQELIRNTMPEVIVPSFPDKPEELTTFMSDLYFDYFEKAVVTDEDKAKTAQYQANSERKKLMDSSLNFEGYLNSLEMKLYRVDPQKNVDRFIQLVNKTNQFNLTTRRITEKEASDILSDDNCEVFLYRVVDRFGDNGIVAAAIIEYGQKAIISEFTMSCRVMGRKIEDAIVEDFEIAAKERGYNELIGLYKPTEKNMPVKDLYSSLGYNITKNCEDVYVEYSIDLKSLAPRKIYVEKMGSEE